MLLGVLLLRIYLPWCCIMLSCTIGLLTIFGALIYLFCTNISTLVFLFPFYCWCANIWGYKWNILAISIQTVLSVQNVNIIYLCPEVLNLTLWLWSPGLHGTLYCLLVHFLPKLFFLQEVKVLLYVYFE